MTRIVSTLVVAAMLSLPATVQGQRGGMGGMDMTGFGNLRFPVPELPGTEMEGPLEPGKATTLLPLAEASAAKYRQAYDSFMAANQPTRDSVNGQLTTMRQKLEAGDRAAATFYAERAVKLSKPLRDRQSKWEEQVAFKGFSGDQVKAYKKWKKDNEAAFQEKSEEKALEWQPRGEAFLRGSATGGIAEPRTVVNPGSAVGGMEGVSQAIRVGRAVYVSGQVALDSVGNVVGVGDLKAQASKAFANLAVVLRAGKAEPGDVVRLTVYVVNYQPEDLVTIRAAATEFFPGRYAPAMTVIGVQSLFRDGLLIAVDAIAQATNPRAQ